MLQFIKFPPAAALVGLLVMSPSVLAEVFKCVDATTGKITFTDVACPDKGSGDYVPVGPANADSGYLSGDKLEQSRREREAREVQERANVAKWQRLADEQAQQENVANHEKKADSLYNQTRWEKDPFKRSSLLRQAEAEQRAAAAATQGNVKAEKHYEKAGEYFEEAKGSRDWGEKSTHTRRGLAEQEAGREAQGLPPTDPPSEHSALSPIPMPAPQPTVITNCDSAGCWDNVGNRYNKGAGQTYFRSDGKTCQGVGGTMQCN